MRLSVVDAVKVNNVGLGSALFVGDNLLINPRDWVIAIQQKNPEYIREQNEFDAPVYRYPKYVLRDKEPVRARFRQESPVIRVRSLRVVSISVSAVVQIGSTRTIDAECRAKHARRIVD